MKKRSSKLTNILFVLVTVGCIVLLVFSDRGLINLWKIKKEKLGIQQEINSLRQEITELQKESEKLQFDEDYIERIAREKLKMARPGEKVFKIE